MVVEGAGKRLALECDGDRYHPMEKLAEDMERQSILERLGWQFVRIRGSAFYRNPDLAMRPVFDRLGELGIFPESPDSNPVVADMTLIHELDEIVRKIAVERELEEDRKPDERKPERRDLFGCARQGSPSIDRTSRTRAASLT
jgi:hypothetical protein